MESRASVDRSRDERTLAVSDGQLEWTPSDAAYDHCYNRHTHQTIRHTSTSPPLADVRTHFEECGGAVAALRWYRVHERLGVIAATLFFALKLLPPLCTRIAWPVLAPFWKRYGSVSVAEVLRRCGMCGPLAELGGAITYLYGDYGAPPARAAWFVHALVSTHYRGGSFFPTGGSSSIAKCLVAGKCVPR